MENLLRNRNKTDLIVARRRHSFGYDSFSRRDLDFIVIPRYDFQMSTRPIIFSDGTKLDESQSTPVEDQIEYKHFSAK